MRFSLTSVYVRLLQCYKFFILEDYRDDAKYMAANTATLSFDQNKGKVCLKGHWTGQNLAPVSKQLKQIDWPSKQKLMLEAKEIDRLDSAGALLICQIVDAIKNKDNQLTQAINEQQQQLVALVEEKYSGSLKSDKKTKKQQPLALIGEKTIDKLKQADGFVILIGQLTLGLMRACADIRKFEFKSIIRTIELTGLKALPIVGLLSFLIGIVLAYQMGIQLQNYGANVYIAFLTGLALFREFAPLITAIIVAGRTSSSFTAQIGSMKINEELDAIKTMGLSPIDLLVIPKVCGLFIAFPLLVFWSDCFGILGAMVMAKFQLGIHYLDFLQRLKESVGLKQYVLGLIKSPVFSILIALVGCYQGFLVKFNSDSVGIQTTKSVVQALFLIIVADAIFSIIYSWMGL